MRYSGLRLLAVHAHPDDEASKAAATTAMYADQGAEVLVVTCTGGERGDILNPRLLGDEDLAANLPARRREEMANAARALGVQHEWLGYEDSGLPEGDPLPPLPQGSFATVDVAEAAGKLVEIVRRFRPQVMLTYNEEGGYPHPDHIMTHKISVAAYEAAHDPGAYPEAGEVWEISKLYYDQGFSAPRIKALHEAILAHGKESPFIGWIERRADAPVRPTTTYVECADYFPQRDQALLAHASQIDPDGFFFAVPRDLEQEVWRTEEFELARSRVETSFPETDLFAGVEPDTGQETA